ncbi:hypothetical protein [uncultured Pelagimonas sp.]|uniref:hypothetical protein n=1 Tax=uncultured Pelagimonas sp. TaxID=1618102 RepID=UPI00262FA942|nr:hypothetical protein [uncultured Pelagimonas sp.]
MSFQNPKFLSASTNAATRVKASGMRSWARRGKRWVYTKTRRNLRYVSMFGMGLVAVWLPSLGYITTATPQFTSQFSLILPGAGSSTSVNLNKFGQASSYANSAFANGSISPTETYKRLIVADRILNAAAMVEQVSREDFGRPKIKLVDQTNLIHVELSADAAPAAQSRARALLASFFAEIDALRQDEIVQRQAGGEDAIADYVTSVRANRTLISDLREDSGLMSADQFKGRVAALEVLAERLQTLNGTAASQASRVANLESALQISAQHAAATLKLFSDEEYRVALAELAEAAALFATAKSKFGARHPERQAAQRTHETAQKAVLTLAASVTGFSMAEVRSLDRAPDGARADLLSELVREHATLEALRKEVSTLSAQHRKDAAEIQRLEPVASELEDRQRDFAVAEAVFASAIARSQSSKTDIYASYPLVQVLEDPNLPTRPSSPKTKLVLAAAIAASLMLAIAATLGWYRKALIDRILTRPTASAATP